MKHALAAVISQNIGCRDLRQASVAFPTPDAVKLKDILVNAERVSMVIVVLLPCCKLSACKAAEGA